MATHARQGAAARHDTHADTRTPAQWYGDIVGLVLVLVGIAGFFVNSSFETGTTQSDDLIVFAVNGWHNVVHLLSGLFLLAVARRADSAKTGVMAFGVIYAVVTVIGLIDGNDILGLLAIDGADNVLHIALTLTAIIAALASDSRRRTIDGRS
jgi:purine-cytosine permease-like protein